MPQRSPQRPNIALLVIDCGRPDHFSGYGYYRQTTPFMDGLAARGRLYRNAFSVATSTPLSHFALMSGQADWGGRAWLQDADANARFLYYARRALRLLGLTNYVGGYDHARHSLLALLNRAGYRSFGISANPLITPEAMRPYQGFDHYLNDELFAGMDSPEVKKQIKAHKLADTTANRNAVHLSADRVFDIAWNHIESAALEAGAPFFLFANLMDCHDPYLVHPSLEEDFGFKPTSSFNGDLRNRLSAKEPASQRTSAWTDTSDLNPADIDLLRWNYDRCLRFIDDQVAHFSQRLADSGALGDTVFIILADHSELLGEGGRFTHSMPEREELLHIPLILAGPGLPPGDFGHPVSITDIRPTILDLLGLRDPFSHRSGRSLLGSQQANRAAVPTQTKQAELGLERKGLSAQEEALLEQRLRDLGYLE